MNLEDKAREYAEGKSSASVFRDAHIRDFKAGYMEGVKDSELNRIEPKLIPDPNFYYTIESRKDALIRYNNGESVKMVENPFYLNKYSSEHKSEKLLTILKEVRKTVDWGYSSWGNDQGFILSEKIDNLIKEYENN